MARTRGLQPASERIYAHLLQKTQQDLQAAGLLLAPMQDDIKMACQAGKLRWNDHQRPRRQHVRNDVTRQTRDTEPTGSRALDRSRIDELDARSQMM